MDDYITKALRIETKQITKGGATEVIPPIGFMIVDIIMSSSQGQATLVARDNENTHILVTTRREFNHAFPYGWTFWKDARLELIKENDLGVVNISVGYVKLYSGLTYDQWRRR